MIEVKDQFELTVDGEKRTILMTFGLLNRLSATVTGMQDLADLGFGAETRVQVITECFRLKGKAGFLPVPEGQLLDLDEISVATEEVEALLDWATQHLTNFFMKRLKAAEKGMLQVTEAVQGVNEAVSGLSQPGLADSTSLTPSAGPST